MPLAGGEHGQGREASSAELFRRPGFDGDGAEEDVPDYLAVLHRHHRDEGHTGLAQGVHERSLVGPPEGRPVDLVNGRAVSRRFGTDLGHDRASRLYGRLRPVFWI